MKGEHIMAQYIWDQETIPLPRLFGWLLEQFLQMHRLALREVARASQLPLLVVWRACRGLPIAFWQAQRLIEGLYTLTGQRYRPPILTHDGPARLVPGCRSRERRDMYA